MKILKEFENFIMRGNVVDLAVAVVVGSVFGKIVTSFVNDILMPPIGILLGGVNFTNLRLVLKEDSTTSAEVAINYGNFLQAAVDFLIISASVFMVVKFVDKFSRKRKEFVPEELSKEEKLLTEIRDILKNK